MFWMGPLNSSPALTHLQLTHSTSPWLLLNPQTGETQQGLSQDLARLLKRRYYLVEKARGAAMVGLLVGTLGAVGYLEVLQELKVLAKEVRCGVCWASF
jgi:diphthamide biosynthesis protein 2